MKIRLSQPTIGVEEREAVARVLDSDRLALGPVTKAFEEHFAKLVDTSYAVAVNSGTSGLHLAIRALGIGEGDEVITSPFSFIASSNCILFERAKPVFIDIEEDTLGLDPSNLAAALTPATKAILPVHIFGQAAQMDPISSFANQHHLHIIEDACEGILATYKGKTVGSFGDVSVFGFYPNKQMTTGEGGMLATDDEQLYDQFLSLRNQGRRTDLQWLSHYQLGYNYRISEITAAIGLEQTKKLKGFVAQRQELANKYFEILGDIEEIKLPHTPSYNTHSWFVYAIQVEEKFRNSLIEHLHQSGIESKAYFYPCIHLQEFYKKDFGYSAGAFPVAEKVSNQTLILPFHLNITEEDIHYIKNCIQNFFSRK